MQSTTIAVQDKTYDRFQETPDKTTYVSDTHSVGSVDLLLLGRTVPSNIDGQAKSRANLIQDFVSGEGAEKVVIGRAYGNIEMSVPAKATDVQCAALLADVRAYVASESFSELFTKQSI